MTLPTASTGFPGLDYTPLLHLPRMGLGQPAVQGAGVGAAMEEPRVLGMKERVEASTLLPSPPPLPFPSPSSFLPQPWARCACYQSASGCPARVVGGETGSVLTRPVACGSGAPSPSQPAHQSPTPSPRAGSAHLQHGFPLPQTKP